VFFPEVYIVVTWRLISPPNILFFEPGAIFLAFMKKILLNFLFLFFYNCFKGFSVNKDFLLFFSPLFTFYTLVEEMRFPGCLSIDHKISVLIT